MAFGLDSSKVGKGRKRIMCRCVDSRLKTEMRRKFYGGGVRPSLFAALAALPKDEQTRQILLHMLLRVSLR